MPKKTGAHSAGSGGKACHREKGGASPEILTGAWRFSQEPGEGCDAQWSPAELTEGLLCPL